MTQQTPKELFDKGLITEDQYSKIEVITSGKIVSVFYELRSLLYLGVLLFTTGAGILIYKNIGDLGHLVSVILLIALTVVCFWYVFKQAPPYTHQAVKSPTPYFDYIVLLGALLFISVIGYLEFLFDIVEEKPGLITLTTSLFFFYIAYRFDHIGVLSLAVTALASFWSISVSPQHWYSGNFFDGDDLHRTAIIFSIVVGASALFLEKKQIKPHFTFTYLNFCSLIFFVATIAGMFIEEQWYLIYLVLIYAGCAFAYYMARWKKSFLFLLYAFLAAYIGTTYLLAQTILVEAGLWFFYSMASCGGFIYFIIRFRNYFKQHS
jgi:hypothetical protein